MDKDTKPVTEPSQQDSTTDMTETTDENAIEQPASEEKQAKGGGGLALLLSLVALLAVAYLYYLNWQRGAIEPTAGVDASQMQAWQDEQANLNKELQKAKADIQSLQQTTEQLEQQVSQQQQQQQLGQRQGAAVGGGGGETLVFDNSPNEQAISQLQQAIADQSRLIQSLQQDVQESGNPIQPTGPMGSALAASHAEMQRQAAVQTVLAVQMMVDSQRIPAAIDTLEQFNQHLNADVELQQRMSALAATLRQADLPDLATAKANLGSLAQAIEQLKVPTVEADEEQAWYEKLISVKKIDEQSPITSTAELMSLKMQLKQHVYEARLNLNLGQASGWQQTLNEAASLVQQQLPNQPALAQSFQQLAQQSITPELPATYDIEAMLAAIKGR